MDGVLSISDVFFRLVPALKKIDVPTVTSRSGIIGISWAGSGGESSALLNDKYLAADGIENVIKVLDEIEKENFAGLEFIELNACSGGCVGGAMNMENPFIAKARLQNLRRYLPVSQNRMRYPGFEGEDDIPHELFWSDTVDYQPIMQLDTDRAEAVRKMQRMQEIDGTLPNLDCGSCGAPSCSALAEDIVRGEADESDCVIRMRQQIEDIWRTMGRMVHDGD